MLLADHPATGLCAPGANGSPGDRTATPGADLTPLSGQAVHPETDWDAQRTVRSPSERQASGWPPIAGTWEPEAPFRPPRTAPLHICLKRGPSPPSGGSHRMFCSGHFTAHVMQWRQFDALSTIFVPSQR